MSSSDDEAPEEVTAVAVRHQNITMCTALILVWHSISW